MNSNKRQINVSPYSNDDREHLVDVQNCIFAGAGTSWMVESGNITQTSLGGNLATSEIADLLNHSTDQPATDPLFTDADNGDFTLQTGSPAINNGVSDNAPADDISGALRDDMPDIGAYEFNGVTAVRNLKKLQGQIELLGIPWQRNWS